MSTFVTDDLTVLGCYETYKNNTTIKQEAKALQIAQLLEYPYNVGISEALKMTL
jgi:hypothetical protein